MFHLQARWHSAGGDDCLAGYVAGIVGHQERHDSGNFWRFAQSAHWHSGDGRIVCGFRFVQLCE